MRKRLGWFVASAILICIAAPALADLTYTQGAGTTIFDFVCFSTKHCSGHVNINSAGTEVGTSGAPLRTDPTGTTTQPASIPTWAGGTLGAMANYGASPGAVLVPGVNAFVTNTLAGITMGDGVTAGTFPTGSPVFSGLFNGTSYDRPRSAGGTGFAGVNPGTPANWGVGATGSAVPANAIYAAALDAVGGVNLVGLAADPCQTSVKTSLPITLATAAVKVIATGVSAKKIYVCAIDVTNNAADSVAIFEATTGTTCATSPIAIAGAGTSVATAATGYNFAANGGISKGHGGFQVMATTVNNNDLCIAQSAATQLTGNITYVTR